MVVVLVNVSCEAISYLLFFISESSSSLLMQTTASLYLSSVSLASDQGSFKKKIIDEMPSLSGSPNKVKRAS